MDEDTQDQMATELEADQAAGERQKPAGPIEQVAEKLNFLKKIGEHWLILSLAALFDLFALVPLVSIIFNACFGLILFLYFGPKSKGGELTKIALPIAAGSVLDLFVGVLPVNIAATMIRIALD